MYVLNFSHEFIDDDEHSCSVYLYYFKDYDEAKKKFKNVFDTFLNEREWLYNGLMFDGLQDEKINEVKEQCYFRYRDAEDSVYIRV